MKAEHLKSVEKVQTLETIKYSLASEEEYLRNENMKMQDFLRNSESNINSNDLSSVVQPKDERSEQVLELTSSLKSRDDCIGLLEVKFNDG